YYRDLPSAVNTYFNFLIKNSKKRQNRLKNTQNHLKPNKKQSTQIQKNAPEGRLGISVRSLIA
ncbi:hypothetical protein, partial [Neptunomonas sp. XY-337]|uniref:hypothetical protein n=1 Tax=Neptunomonas sp. XY-337 TaxID=2561897 RepID=UPI00197F0C59